MPFARILRISCLVGLLAAGSSLARAAAGAPPATQPAEDRPIAQGDPAVLIDRLREQLAEMKLTDDQKQKIDAALDKAEQSLKLMDQELQNATQSQRAGRMREILNEVRDQIRSVLSPQEQQELRTKISSSTANRLQRLREALAKIGLSDDQKQKIKSLFDDTREKVEEARKDAAASGQDSTEKLRAAGAQLREKLAEILTDEQLLQLRDFMENSAAPTTQPQSAK